MDEPTRQAVLKLFRDTIARVEAENKTALANMEAFFKSLPRAQALYGGAGGNVAPVVSYGLKGGAASSPQSGMRQIVIDRLQETRWHGHLSDAYEGSPPSLYFMTDAELLDLYNKHC